jgi:hypothetical protein
MPDIEIRGLDELYDRLGKVVASETLYPPMHRALLDLQYRMAQYPDPPAKSTYQRTNTLKREWTAATPQIDAHTGGVTGRVGTVTEYAPLVQKAGEQAWYHARTGWQTDEQVLAEAMPGIVADFEDAISQALEGK